MPRPSPVLDAVRGLIQGPSRHTWSIDELHEAVRSELGAADYSSVFRALAALEKEGAVDRIELGDGKARFEVHDEHHEHVRCESCGRVAEVAGCVLDGAASGVQRQTGFVVSGHRLVFTGLCPDCARRAG